jgi:hypothetical protein
MLEFSKPQAFSDSQRRFTHVEAFFVLLTETLEERVKCSVRSMSLEVLTAALQKIYVLREVTQWCWGVI